MPSYRNIISSCLLVLCTLAFAQAGAERLHPYGPQSGNTTQFHPSKSGNRDAKLLGLIKELRSQGAAVRREAKVSQPFFSVKGRGLSVNGESVQVFIYPSTRAARSEAGRVSPAGTSVGTNIISWMATPHFYRRGNLIVLYVGTNPTVRRTLETVLGTQFAGG